MVEVGLKIPKYLPIIDAAHMYQPPSKTVFVSVHVGFSFISVLLPIVTRVGDQ